jgi:tRNA modification GTPase
MLELEVDFAEEEADSDQAGWKEQLESIARQIDVLCNGFRSAAVANRTPAVVFYGAPNAGKSSLVNSLLDEERLLVSAKAGTTRDVVEVHLLLDRGEVRLVDTAGLSAMPVDEIDAASQQKAKQRIGRADLSVLLVDGSVPLGSGTIESIREAQEQGHWVVATKADQPVLAEGLPTGTLHVSALTRCGIDAILSQLNDALFPELLAMEDFWVSSERQLECLVGAAQGVQKGIHMLDQGRNAPEELAFELFSVRNLLMGITGQISTDEILDVIFRKFCIGK